jgi:hypothetical protein
VVPSSVVVVDVAETRAPAALAELLNLNLSVVLLSVL